MVHNSGSFPSGHSASAFAMATVFALLFNNKRISIIAFILAVLVGYSRIYLALHFLQDVIAGAFIGVFFGSLAIISYGSKKDHFPIGNLLLTILILACTALISGYQSIEFI